MLAGMMLQIAFGLLCGLSSHFALHVLFRCLTAIACALMYSSGQMISKHLTIVYTYATQRYTFLFPISFRLKNNSHFFRTFNQIPYDILLWWCHWRTLNMASIYRCFCLKCNSTIM